MTFKEYRMSGLGEGWEGSAVDEFFDGVLNRLGYSLFQRKQHCEIRAREIAYDHQQEGEPFHATDDRVTELWFDRWTIATVLEIRNEFNFMQMLFADYVTPELREELYARIAPAELPVAE